MIWKDHNSWIIGFIEFMCPVSFGHNTYWCCYKDHSLEWIRRLSKWNLPGDNIFFLYQCDEGTSMPGHCYNTLIIYWIATVLLHTVSVCLRGYERLELVSLMGGWFKKSIIRLNIWSDLVLFLTVQHTCSTYLIMSNTSPPISNVLLLYFTYYLNFSCFLYRTWEYS